MTVYKIFSRVKDMSGSFLGYRTEFVSTIKNPIFQECKDANDVKVCFLNFWNKLPTHQTEQVEVDLIQETNLSDVEENFGIEMLKPIGEE